MNQRMKTLTAFRESQGQANQNSATTASTVMCNYDSTTDQGDLEKHDFSEQDHTKEPSLATLKDTSD